MMELDTQEELALKEFLQILEEQRFEPKPDIVEDRIQRGPNGQIIVPVTLKAKDPSWSLAQLMGHKADQIYKQTACRLVLAQCLEREPSLQMYIWADNAWSTIS